MTTHHLVFAQKIPLRNDWTLKYFVHWEHKASEERGSVKEIMQKGLIRLEMPVVRLELNEAKQGEMELVLHFREADGGVFASGRFLMEVQDDQAFQIAMKQAEVQ